LASNAHKIAEAISKSEFDDNTKSALIGALIAFDQALWKRVMDGHLAYGQYDSLRVDAKITYDSGTECMNMNAPSMLYPDIYTYEFENVNCKYNDSSGSENVMLYDILFAEFLKNFSGKKKADDKIDYGADAIFPSGYASCSNGHQAFVYVKKCSNIANLWHVQEINFGSGKAESEVESTYCTLSSFGRHLVLSEQQLHCFLSDIQGPRVIRGNIQENTNRYSAIWEQYAKLNDGHSAIFKANSASWENVSYSYAQRSGNCVMRSTEGVVKAALLARFSDIDMLSNDGSGNITKIGDVNKKLNNTITLHYYEIISRMGILRHYLERSKNKTMKDNLYLLEMATGQLGRRIGKLQTKLSKYGTDVQTPYLVDGFFENLKTNFQRISEDVEKHTHSDEARKILYEKVEDAKINTSAYVDERKYALETNENAGEALKDLYENATYRYTSWVIHPKIELTDFTKIKNGDISYATCALVELFEVAKNSEYAKLAAGKMIDIIQHIPFNGNEKLNFSILTGQECAKLLDVLRRSLAVIDEEHKAFDGFFQKPRKGRSKNLQWQLHDIDGTFDQYNLTQMVNAYSVASIIMLRIISENINVLNGIGMEIMKGKSFDYAQYLKYYSSFSYYPHRPIDAEIAKRIICYLNSQEKEEKNIVFAHADCKAKMAAPIWQSNVDARIIRGLLDKN
jgi:hypothetical protein